MRMRILGSVAALVLIAAMTSGAMASGRRGAGGHHGRYGHRVVGNYNGWNNGPHNQAHYTDLGPLGVMFGPPPGRGTCGPNCIPGSSISAWSY